MALWRRRDVGQAFRNDLQLQEYVLTDVTPTGRVLGTGSYGSVEEVSYKHLVCAGKKLHETLIEVGNDGVDEVVHKYLQECQLMASLHHPNITQFLGLCFLPGTQLPLLVMERLETSLDDLLEHMPNLPLSLKRSVLEDVARGLLYLHDRRPPVIHRDLTSKNILLTSSLVAKITDMGNSRIVNMRPGQMARTLTKYPGTLVYMPPEAQNDTHRYGASMDVFSFGHLALYTVTQTFPGDLLPSTYLDPDNLQDIKARSEVERRGVYIQLLESISAKHPVLAELVKQCLHNNPRERPSTEELLTTLQGMRMEVEGEHGGLFKPDMARLRLSKEVKEKDRRIEELTQQQMQVRELEEMRRNAGDSTRQLEESIHELHVEIQLKNDQIASNHSEIARKDREIASLLEDKGRCIDELQAEIQTKNTEIARKVREITTRGALLEEKGRRIDELRAEIQTKNDQLGIRDWEIAAQIEGFQVREAELRRELEAKEAEITRLRGLPGGTNKELLQLPLQLTWMQGPDMPFSKSSDSLVVTEGRFYVGGGKGTEKIVLEYDIIAKGWKQLPMYTLYYFTMTVIKNQLVLVGGAYPPSKLLGVWADDRKVWTHPYPEMPTPRTTCSALGYKEWLIIAGGWAPGGSDEYTSTVDILNTESKQWHTGPPTPIPWCNMKTTVVGNTAYFMGGVYRKQKHPTDDIHDVYSICIPTLISHITTKTSSGTQKGLWKKIPGMQLTRSIPLSIRGSLMAIGGIDNKQNPVTDIHLYHPDSKKWIKVGDLPSPRHNCSCAMIADKQIIVAGGKDRLHNELRSVDLGFLK